MLVSLHIRNVLLIEDLHIDFTEGFSVVLGETGAGKSMLINCLSVVLGDRARQDMIRVGADKATIVACFNVKRNTVITDILQEHDVPHSDILLIRKVILRDAGSRIYVNDMPVNIGFVSQLTEYLIEINSQFSQSRFAKVGEHRKILDEYGDLMSDLSLLSERFADYKAAKQNLLDSRRNMEQIKQDYEYYSKLIRDIEPLSLTPRTELDLLEKKKAIVGSYRLLEAYKNIRDDWSRGKLISFFNSADNILNRVVTAYDQGDIFSQIMKHIHDAHSAVQEVMALLEDQLAALQSDAQILESIDSTLFELRTLARKYGTTADKLPDKLAVARDKVAFLDHSQQFIDNYEQQLEEATKGYLALAQSISDKRHLMARQISEAVLRELKFLKMENVDFIVQINSNVEHFFEHGIDEVCFCVAMNAGNKIMPLHKVASGGELSRFMLALRIVLSRVKNLSTIVFDEIDSGVSGEVANAIADKMRLLSNNLQVIAVTHSHQVASRGDSHFKVQKQMDEGSYKLSVTVLKGSDIASEIARMISGDHLDDASLMAAKSMLTSSVDH